ncbi:MAG: hypothetical protein HY815_20180 [Candidatus Riflebacteria bacterium]|nr:hypothetical protein [Candidatus Riflebacteria bacterium]
MRRLLLVLLLAGVLPGQRPSSAAPLLGVNFHGPIDQGVVMALEALGARIVRTEVGFNNVFPEPGRPSFGGFDRTVAGLRAGRRELIVLLTYSPLWASRQTAARYGYPTDPKMVQSYFVPPDRLSAWADYVRAVARRYRPVLYYELWNEANGRWFLPQGVSTPPQVRREILARYYVPMLEVTRQVLRKEDPGARLIGPGAVNDVKGEFLLDLVRAGAGPLLDGVSIHVYPDPDRPFSSFLYWWRRQEEVLREVRALSGRTLPVVVSEIGLERARPGRTDLEADFFRLALPRILRFPGVDAIAVHCLVDGGPGGGRFGLSDRGRPLPSGSALATVASLIGAGPVRPVPDLRMRLARRVAGEVVDGACLEVGTESDRRWVLVLTRGFGGWSPPPAGALEPTRITVRLPAPAARAWEVGPDGARRSLRCTRSDRGWALTIDMPAVKEDRAWPVRVMVLGR